MFNAIMSKPVIMAKALMYLGLWKEYISLLITVSLYLLM